MVDLDRQGSGGTTDGGRRTATANGDGDAMTTTKWAGFPPEFFPYSNRLFRFPSDLQMGWLSSFFLPFFEQFFAIWFRSGNLFHLFVIYRVFCFNSWEFKNGSRVVVFCQWNLCLFHA